MVLFISACSGVNTARDSLSLYSNAGDARIQPAPLAKRFANTPQLDGKKMTIAVYKFADKTGQRKPADNIANLSSAVTQGSEVWVIKALSEVGNESWFEPVERVGMDHLIKERQLIRNTREVYEKDSPNGPRALKPMVFAGLILEGGIVGYDTNTTSGGAGMRYFGLGVGEEYRTDQVTVSLRLVGVQTGEILLTTNVTKTIASHSKGGDVFTFLDLNTKALELESGVAVNEPVTYAIRTAIEYAILDLIKTGKDKGYWKYKEDKLEGIHKK